ncbi:MAG TPA: choice-of-anchor B family protein [Caldithrix abyssi]|uniref:Choice-of-anchor B family protein n=1 Tax=Caldithrix abyssi TaxID=187145 RepID=A0A7V5VEP6_CALAY|nr:choice-of-anchor B family protein [Caldithrix abyssi]
MKKTLTILLLILCGALQAQNIEKLGQWKPGEFVNDVWGYDAPDGRYYAIIGAESGTYVLDVSDPGNISQVGYVKGNKSIWRDIKNYGPYVYVTNENQGLDILDLSKAPQEVRHVQMMNVPGYHNVFIDTAGAQMFLADAGSDGGVKVYSLKDPENPRFIYSFGTETHDVYVRDRIAYCAQGRKGTIGIYDISDRENVKLLKSIAIPNAGYVHNTWLSKSGDYLLSTEETAHKTVKIWDIRDLEKIVMKGEYLGKSQLAHNVQVEGDYAYVSHYESGVSVLDLHDPQQMTFVGNYDAYPAGDNPEYNGTWGVYPHSRSGRIYISGDNHGLLVLQFNGARASMYAGHVSDAQSGAGLDGAHVHLPLTGLDVHTDAEGSYAFSAALTGKTDMRVQAFGYREKTVSLQPNENGADTVNVELEPGARTELRVSVLDPEGQPVAGALVRLHLESTLLEEPRVYEAASDEKGLAVFGDLVPSAGEEAAYTSLLVDGGQAPYSYASYDTVFLEEREFTALTVTLSAPDVLIVNSDPRGAYGNYIREALGKIGLASSVYELSAQSIAPGESYAGRLNIRRVIWITGDASEDVLDTGAQDSIKSLLSAGISVLLSGQNIAEYLQRTGSPFLSDWLRVAYFANTTSNVLGVDSNHPVGSGLSQLGLYGDGGANNQTSSDLLKALSDKGASSVFWYGGSPANTAAVAVPYDEYNSKLFFAGFGIEAVSSANEDQASLDQLLNNVINWFDGVTALNGEGLFSPRGFKLEANYPNPFNPATHIRYHLARPVKVRLSVFDLSGREVAVLVNTTQPGGEYTVNFNAGRLASGLYFFRLRAGEYTETRRMTLLR